MSANGQIRDLEKRLAAAEKLAAHVGEYRYAVPGHPAGDCIYTTATKGPNGKWAVTDGTGRSWVTRYWNGVTWCDITGGISAADVYRYEEEQARELAEQLAAGEAAAHAAWLAKRPADSEAVAL